MNWKNSTAYNALPPAEADIPAYLETHVSELCGLKEIKARTGHGGWVYAEDEEAIRLNRSYGWPRPYEEQPLRYQASHYPTPNRIIMHNLLAKPKGHGLGQLFAKIILGWAHDRDVNEIVAQKLQDGGITFWPAMGAMPQTPPAGIGEVIRAHAKRGLHLRDDDCRKFESIAETAGTNPYLAFRQLGLLHDKTPFSEINRCRHGILKEICADKDFIWLPSEISTARIVETRLGALYPLRPLDPHGRYRDIIAALHPAATAAPHNRL